MSESLLIACDCGAACSCGAEEFSTRNLPSVEDFPRCINCIYSLDNGEDCRRHRVSEECSLPCGDGVFAVGATGNRQLVTYLGWWEDKITREKYIGGEVSLNSVIDPSGVLARELGL